jgi:hypothetical protein
MPAATYTHSIASLSWIDPRLFDAESLPEVDHKGDPGDLVFRDLIVGAKAYRFANFLEASITVADNGDITDRKFTPASTMYSNTSYRGIIPQSFEQKSELVATPKGDGIQFRQIVGCKTVSPETIGAVTAGRSVAAALGIPRGWEGAFGTSDALNSAAKVGKAAAEQIRVFPPIWTQVELTIYNDGGFDGRLLRHSLFPSLTFYIQFYSVEALTVNVTKYTKIAGYDARAKIDEWREKGWGPILPPAAKSGPIAGNPWVIADPRIFGCDIPVPLGIPAE